MTDERQRRVSTGEKSSADRDSRPSDGRRLSAASGTRRNAESETEHGAPFLSNRAVGALVQTKLRVSNPNSHAERQADAIADRVLDDVRGREAESPTGGLPAPQRPRSGARGYGQGPAADLSLDTPDDLEGRITSSLGQGQEIETGTKREMENKLEADFGDVRVHTDSSADSLARRLDAMAFTTGNDIFFARGRYSPGTKEGDRLLAHELVHVVQQNGTGSHRGSAVARQKAEGQAADVGGSSPTTLRMRDPMSELRTGLEREGLGDWWGLISGLPRGAPDATVPTLLPDLGPEGQQVIFGPLTGDQAIKAASSLPEKPDWFDKMVASQRSAEEHAVDLYIVYENDGTGIVPNFGSGSDQGRTAALYIFSEFNKSSTGLSRAGVSYEMVTPKGTLPEGAAFGPESTYETAKGPYSGILTADVGVTVARSGSTSVEVFFSAGLDSRRLGEIVQDKIHEDVSNSPVFPWPSGTKPIAEGGVGWNHTINDLTSGDFYGLSYRGSLDIDAQALTGTRRTEAEIGARYVIRSAEVDTPLGPLSVEFSPVGAVMRGFMRYNDGRPEVSIGAEAGVKASFMVNLGNVGLGITGEAISSTDPAFQTDLPAGSAPTALQGSPFVGKGYGMPAAHHGTGQLVLKISF